MTKLGGSGNSWGHMPDNQPRECGTCGSRVRISYGSTGFKTIEPLSTTCAECMNTTLLLSFDGCPYCLTARAAVQDAHDHHRRTG